VDSSKIPTYAMLLNRAPGIDLRILHLVRDSRGVVNSWRKQVTRLDGGGVDEMYRYGLASATFRYDLYNVLAQTFARWRTPYLRIRYEDLVREPLATLEQVCVFLGIDGIDRVTESTVNERPYVSSMTETERAHLMNAYRLEIERLEKLLGWDCRDWLDRT